MWSDFLGRLMSGLISRAIAVVIVMALAGIGMIYRATSFDVTDAVITSVETDCFIKDSNAELKKNSTNERAYMDCDIAPLAAAEFKFSASAIQKRSKVTYRYVSPVDKKEHVDATTFDSTNQNFRTGEVYAVLAHKGKADKTLWADAKQQREAAAKRTQSNDAHAAAHPANGATSGLRGRL
jgi:hypothetical protein